ncbi:MAG: hypothetical protein HOV81_00820 [Kofleriaceae bacterium]|nr:hypothetical protein [Kofleriaceae bacterium]
MRRLWAVAIVAGCSFEHGAPIAAIDARESDATIDSPPVTPTGWSAPVEIAELTSGTGDDDPSLTNDLLEIYWGSHRAGGYGGEDIWVARRASPTDPWGTPSNVTELNSAFAETTMKVTGDGLAMYFTSTRGGNADLYFSSRMSRSDAWSIPQLSSLSTVYGDYGAFVQSDLRHVIFCMGDIVANEALYEADRTSPQASWPTPTRVDELDEANISECDPMEPSGRTLYYASARGDGVTYDIFTAQRNSAADPYAARTAVDAANLPNANDRDPWVSQDEKLMVFASDRSGVDRLYVTTRP